MKQLLCDIEKIAKSNASVFISGESGTGKEVIAQAIHELSLRSKKPFIKVNCAAIPESLLESEFFGHEKGSFTGANVRKEGRYELLDNENILLDEVTEFPVCLQPKLLRAIQEQEFERVGGTRSLSVDIRFISTSNRMMKQAIASNLFREDLFYRLSVMPIRAPSAGAPRGHSGAFPVFFRSFLSGKPQTQKNAISGRRTKTAGLLLAGKRSRACQYHRAHRRHGFCPHHCKRASLPGRLACTNADCFFFRHLFGRNGKTPHLRNAPKRKTESL